jgi:multiple sugar transport system permease protein
MRRFGKIIFFIVMAFIVVIMLFPIVFTVLNSLMSGAEIADRYSKTITPTNSFNTTLGYMHFAQLGIIPYYVTFAQYFKMLFQRPDIMGHFINSALITAVVVLGQCLVSAPAAYAFEQSRSRWTEVLFFIYIAIMLMPLQVVLVPNFIVANWLNLGESYWAIILPGIFNPFGTFLMRQQMRGYPREYREASQIDGASHLDYFRYVLLPAVRPTIVVLAVLTFAEYWNLVDQAIIFIRESWREPMSLFLSRLADYDVGMLFAASVIYIVPAIFLFIAQHKSLEEGISLSGIK